MWTISLAALLSLQPVGPDPQYHRSEATDGSGIWHVTEPRERTGNATEISRNSQRLVVRFVDPPIFKPDMERACYVRARVIAVENGDRIRNGDLIQLRRGCASANQGVFNRLFPPAQLRAGATAHLHIDQNAELQRVEFPVPAR